MHTNHRRKNRHRASHHNCNEWVPYRLIWGIEAKYRARVRALMAHEKYDLIPPWRLQWWDDYY